MNNKLQIIGVILRRKRKKLKTNKKAQADSNLVETTGIIITGDTKTLTHKPIRKSI